MAPFKGLLARSLLRASVLALAGQCATVWANESDWARYQQALKIRHYDEALQILQLMANQNDPKATLMLAQWFRNGTAGQQDSVKARQWMQKAADQGLAEAQYQLALMYEKGIGGEANAAIAKLWLQKSAQQQYAKARQALEDWQAPAVDAAPVVADKPAEPREISRPTRSPAPTLSPLQQRLAAVQESAQQLPALRRAVLANDEAMVQALLGQFTPAQQSQVWQADENGQTLVTLASQQASPAVLSLLLEHSPQSSWQDRQGRNALFHALKGRRQDNIAVLLKAGIDPLQSDLAHQTPLETAIAQNGDAAMALLQATDSKRWKPQWLPVAMKQKAGAMVDRLLKGGMAIDAVDAEGRTALAYAALQGDLKRVSALLMAGADLRHADNSGVTPLHLACQQGYGDVVDALLSSYHGPLTAVLAQGDARGSTPLHLAAAAGQGEVITRLNNRNADINARDGAGNTPLMVAVMNNRPRIVSQLLQLGALQEKRNNNKKNALEISQQLGNDEISGLLQQAGKRSGVMSIFQ